MSGGPSISFPLNSLIPTFVIFLIILPQCLSSPGLFNFTGPNAFIELDTQPFSCSVQSQANFSIKFEVFPMTNSSVLFTGISGSILPSDGLNFLGAQGDPLALFIYIERPYFSLTLMRLTDYQIRLYLPHAFGIFDRSWHGWHKVEIVLSKRGRSRISVTFKVDQKSNYAYLTNGDIMWPDWRVLKAFAPKEMDAKRRFYFNEAFLGSPSPGTMSSYATDIMIKYQGAIRAVYARPKVTENVFAKFVPFRGVIQSFLLSSDCACGVGNYFSPKMIQLGPGINVSNVCDSTSLPPLAGQLPGSCIAETPEIPCGCSTQKCFCPDRRSCSVMKKPGWL